MLHVLSELGTGGAAVVHRLLADRLADEGVHVDVFSFSSSGWENIFGDYPCERLFFRDRMTLTELLCRDDYDVVHGATDIPDRGLGRSLALSRSRAAVVLTCHGGELPAHGLSCGHVLVTVSRAMADDLQDKVDVPIRTIYNGIDDELFCPGGMESERPVRPVIAWVGRPYDARKDFIGFAALAQALADDDVELWAVLACPEDYPVSIDQWTGERMRVIRNLSQRQMADTYRLIVASGGCVVSTSLSEGFGMSIVEAMACGCPVVAPAVGGVHEVLDDAGLIYERPVRAAKLRRLVLELIGNTEMRSAVILRGLNRVKRNFTANQMAASYHELYEELLSKRPRNAASCLDRVSRFGMRTVCAAKRFWSR